MRPPKTFDNLDDMLNDSEVLDVLTTKYQSDMPYGTITGDTDTPDCWLNDFYCRYPDTLEQDCEDLNITLTEF